MKYPYLLLLIFISQLAVAQEEQVTSCVQNIETAQQRYDDGRIQDIQALLADCLDNGNYTKAEESQALRLLALSYIFLDDERNSEATMLRLISANHEFETNPAVDPTEFINLHARFRTEPLFNIGVRYIVNFSQPIVVDLNSALNLNGGRPEYTLVFANFGVGVNFEYEFKENFIIYPEIHYKSTSISRTFQQNGLINTSTVWATIENFEDQDWISLPVSVKYRFPLENIPDFSVYANLGGSVEFLLKSSRPSDGSKLTTANDPDVGFTNTTSKDKNQFNFGIIAGAGATYKMGEGFISLEARYFYSLSKFTNPANILNPVNSNQINTFVQDDIYRLNYIAISIGYTRYMYFPLKLR